jgi:hypothetical protein
MEYISGKMEESMMVNIREIKSTVRVYIYTLMDLSLKVNGKMDSKMDKDIFMIRKE